jgi:hypothetical protein
MGYGLTESPCHSGKNQRNVRLVENYPKRVLSEKTFPDNTCFRLLSGKFYLIINGYIFPKQTGCEFTRSDAAVFLKNKKPFETDRTGL